MIIFLQLSSTVETKISSLFSSAERRINENVSMCIRVHVHLPNRNLRLVITFDPTGGRRCRSEQLPSPIGYQADSGCNIHAAFQPPTIIAFMRFRFKTFDGDAVRLLLSNN